jgi:hypothetical protein
MTPMKLESDERLHDLRRANLERIAEERRRINGWRNAFVDFSGLLEVAPNHETLFIERAMRVLLGE